MAFLADYDYPPTMTDIYAPEKDSNMIRNAFKYSNLLSSTDQWSASSTDSCFFVEAESISTPTTSVVDEPAVWNQFVESILGNEPIEVNSQVDLSPEKQGRKRKLSEKTEKEALNSELDLDDYRKMRIRFVNSSFFFVNNFFRNNIAVRKSRKRTKMRAEKINTKVTELVAESEKLQEMISHIQQQSFVLETKAKRAERQIDETQKVMIHFT